MLSLLTLSPQGQLYKAMKELKTVSGPGCERVSIAPHRASQSQMTPFSAWVGRARLYQSNTKDLRTQTSLLGNHTFLRHKMLVLVNNLDSAPSSWGRSRKITSQNKQMLFILTVILVKVGRHTPQALPAITADSVHVHSYYY